MVNEEVLTDEAVRHYALCNRCNSSDAIILPKGIRDFEWVQKAKVKEVIEKKLPCARLNGCQKGFECWACSSRRKLQKALGIK